MNDCLSLPLRQAGAGTRTLTNWEMLWMPLGEGESLGLPLGKGSGWSQATVPRQEAATEGRQAIWYRAVFNRPDHSGRVLLRLGGAFLATNVWLNGRLLGSHYGYFAPFGFDLSPFLRADNLLVICCESPVETDLMAKRHVLGVFADGDGRPYPSSAYFGLPEPYRWQVPVGLWRPVELAYTGSVIVDWMRLHPRLEAGDGRLDIEVRLRNLDAREMAGVVGFEVTSPQGRPLRLVREYQVPGGLEQTVAVTLSIPDAVRWQPWRLGPAELYRLQATVLVDGRLSTQLEESFGFRELDVRPSHRGWSVRVNGQPLFLRGANYTPAYQLDSLNLEVFRRDFKLAREANLDALRVHGHVLPEEFYREADAQGMLVWADFPLTGAYAYHASGEDTRFFESAVREQVPEMVELLRNRPSVILWCAHDDPPWISANSDLGDVHAVRQNYTIDQEARALFERLDPARPALAASGDLDAHAYLGWREGRWQEFADAEPALVSEFGVPALPSSGSAVWRELGARWPIADDDPGWIHAGFEPARWAEHGVGLPSEYPSLQAFIDAGQAYQAFVARFAAEQLRKRKFHPCWGAFVYELVDPFPGVGFGLLDASRTPKPAYEEVAHALAPTRVIVDPVGFLASSSASICFGPRAPVGIRLVVVNDDPGRNGVARIRWTVYRERLSAAGGFGWLRDAVRKRSYAGAVDFQLPGWSEPAVQATSLSLPLGEEADYRLLAQLFVEGEAVDSTTLDFSVGAGGEGDRASPAQLPAYLAARLVEPGSLHGDDRALRVVLLNRTRPAYLAGVEACALDGVPLPDADVRLDTGGTPAPLPRRLELPLERPVKLVVEPRRPVEPGEHELELELRVPGVAEGRVKVRGTVAAGQLSRNG